MSEQKTIIYIASDLRSGSTLLDRLLSNHPQIETVGELKNLNHYLTLSPIGPGTTRSWICRCGVRLAECRFWSKIIDQFCTREKMEMAQLQTAAKLNLKSIMCGLLSAIALLAPNKLRMKLNELFYSNDHNHSIAENCYTILEYVHRVSNKPIYVDSSKRPEQLYAMNSAKPDNCQLKVIHLVRDGRAVTYSALKRSAEAGKKNSFFRMLISWISINLMIQNLRPLFGQKEFIRIRYEDLCIDTEGAIRRICAMFDLPFDAAMTEIIEGQKHNIGGTPRQFDRHTRIRLDQRWKTTIPLYQKLIFLCLAGWVNRAFGY